MKKYLLVVFEDFSNPATVSKLIVGMTPIVDSPQLKLHHNGNSIVLHFATEVLQEDLTAFIEGIFYGVSDYHILTEYTDKVSVSMSEDLKAHLLNLEDMTEYSSPTNSGYSITDENFQENAEEFVNLLLDEFHTEVKVPTLNELLDKINDKGIKSLTQFEKEILDNYSKN